MMNRKNELKEAKWDKFPGLIDSPLISPHSFGTHATISDKTLEIVICTSNVPGFIIIALQGK